MTFQTLSSSCQFVATTNGIGNFIVASAVIGKLTPEQANVLDGAVHTYYAQSLDGTQWESGSGAYSVSTHTLSRTTIIANSNGDLNPVSFLLPPIVTVVPNATTTNIDTSIMIAGAVDLNTIAVPGTYSCLATTNTNGPTAGGQWYIDVEVKGSDPTHYLMQRATSMLADATIYTRVMIAGTWQAWQQSVMTPLTTPLFTTLTNSLGADVLLINTATFSDGPSIAQGTVGKWFVSGQVTCNDTAGVASLVAKLWDGTTVIDSGLATVAAAFGRVVIALSGVITNPAGNLRISAQDGTSTNGRILFNASGLSKDSTITGIRIG